MKKAKVSRGLMAVCAGVGLMAMAVPSAMAVSVETSRSGSDYSQNDSTGKKITLRDGECDGHGVRSDYVLTGSSTTNSFDNYIGCNNSNSVSTSRLVYKHRVVEVIPVSADDYGAWVYPK
ncbi:hypothetical protein [Nostocoides sp. Soil756]|uniref:hypothetical protein n=1 Tax=Nostocoides sp. Soil756 TaxID=1736399 RepID=UPI000A87FA9F|nr:hypothetical protein [Tetrasphaera sp. Soil756]